MSYNDQLVHMQTGSGFIAALDQSGGSTPKALKLYGIDDSRYQSNAEMFDLVHAMRTRIITNPEFKSGSILGAILFEDTMDRQIDNQSTSQYLWFHKQIVPFLKVDKGLMDESGGVQLMHPIPDLNDLLNRAKRLDVFGTKMRSVIKAANPDGIEAIVAQQFDLARQILSHGLVPIIEPEVDINAPDKRDCEVHLRTALVRHIDALAADSLVMLKLTLPSEPNYYCGLCNHDKVLKVVALSGGYTRDEANQKLAENTGVIASFSRALTEGLTANSTEAQFTKALGQSIAEIVAASSS